MALYRKKTVIVESERFTTNGTVLHSGAMFMEWVIQSDNQGYFLMIKTSTGYRRVNDGDWIIKDATGEYYSYNPSEFENNYEIVSETSSKQTIFESYKDGYMSAIETLQYALSAFDEFKSNMEQQEK